MSDDVAARYARPRRRGATVLATVVGVALAAGALVTVSLGVLDSEVRWREVSFVTEADQVELTFEVFAREGDTVRCQVRATDERYADVGQADVDLGPLPARGVSRTVTIRTVSPATSASVRACTVLPDGLN